MATIYQVKYFVKEDYLPYVRIYTDHGKALASVEGFRAKYGDKFQLVIMYEMRECCGEFISVNDWRFEADTVG